jgi:hypothetical protein
MKKTLISTKNQLSHLCGIFVARARINAKLMKTCCNLKIYMGIDKFFTDGGVVVVVVVVEVVVVDVEVVVVDVDDSVDAAAVVEVSNVCVASITAPSELS